MRINSSLTRVLRNLGVALALLAIVVYVGYLVVYVDYAVGLFRWPFDYDQGEGFELYDAVLFSQGEWPYRDNATFPFYASNYPPLFHLLIVPLLPFLGPRLIAGRVVSFGATLLAAAVIFTIVRRELASGEGEPRGWLQEWFVPLISALGFLASNYVYQIGPLCRMHMTLVMFELLAIAFIARFEHPEHGNRNLVIGLLMLLFAGYTKQTAVFTVVAGLSFVLLRDIKKALIAGAALALVAGFIFGLLNVATGGQWWVNIIQANVNDYDYGQTIFLFRQWSRIHALFVLLAGGYLVYELFWDRLSAYSLWFFFALGVGALSGKWGAGFGYFTTAIAAACVASGLAIGRSWQAVQERSWELRSLLVVAIPLLYLVQAPRMLHLPTTGPFFGPLAHLLGVADQKIEGDCTTFEYYDSMGYTQLGHPLTAEDYAAGATIMDYVQAAEGPIFSEEAMFSLLSDKPVVTNPTQLLNLYNNGLLDTSSIIEHIDRQAFDLVIFRAQFYPPPVLEAIGQNYRPVEHVCMNGFYYHLLWPERVLEGRGDGGG